MFYRTLQWSLIQQDKPVGPESFYQPSLYNSPLTRFFGLIVLLYMYLLNN